MSGTDYTQTPSLGLYKPIANRAVGTWGDLWNANADALDSAIHFATGGGPYLPLSGGILTGPGGSTVALTINTGNNGPACNNGLEVVQGYNGGGLAMHGNDTPHTASVRFGSLTFNDHNAMVFNYPSGGGGRATGQYNNLESVLTIPASPGSSQLTNAFTASVVDYSGGGALASIFYAIAQTNNTTLYAINSVCTDSAPANSGQFTGIREQIEFDYFVRNQSTTVRGVMVGLSATVPQLNQTSWIGFETTLFPGSQPWSVAYSSGNGTANTALLVGTTGPYGNPVETGDKSQTIQFLYTNNTVATSQRSISLWSDPTYLGPNGVVAPTGADLRIADVQFPGEQANLALSNLSYLKAVNAAGTATLNLIGLNGQDQMEIGGGVQTILIRGYNGGTASIAQFNAAPNAVNNVQFTGGVAGSPPTVSSFHGQLGTDTNIGLNINAFGTGVITLGSPTRINGNVGFNTAPIAKPTVTGAKGSNAALGSLLTALAAYGLVTDTTTA